MTSAPARTREFRSDVQGLRAVAVGLVLLYHAGMPLIHGGYIGVDVFFVISGFLISSHLLETLERDGRLNFGQFYARRARRILPASFVVAALTAVSVVIFLPPLSVTTALRDAVATVLYVPNIWFAAQDTNYLADHAASPYQHYWSLGVEEHFYLLWPLLLLAIFLLLRRRRSRVVIAIAAVAAASLVACLMLTATQQPLAFFLLPTRAWELLAGALVGAAVLGRTPRLPAWVAGVGGWLGLTAIIVGALVFDESTTFPGWAATLPVAGTAAVIYFGTNAPRWGATAVLSLRPMQFVGLISYSLYLVHWPLLVVTQAALGDEHPLRLWERVGLGIVLAVPLAYLLYRFVENPLRRTPALTRRRPRATLLTAGAMSVVLAVALGGGSAWASGQRLTGGGDVAAAPSTPTAPPTATRFVPKNLTPRLEQVDADLPDVYADDCHHDTVQTSVQKCAYGDKDAARRVALFGDSHSAQWLPALQRLAAEGSGMQIDTYTKSSCPSVDTTVLLKNVPYATCDTWRRAVMAHLLADPPALVVISNYSAYDLQGVTGSSARRTVWAEGLGRTVKALRDAGSDVLVIADTPRFDTAPSVCVSAHLTDVTPCAGSRATVLDAAQTAAEKQTTVSAGGRYADLTSYICDAKSCPPIIDDMLVYRDVNHLTATFVRYLAPLLAADVVPAG